MSDLERMRTEDLERELPGAFPDNGPIATSQAEYSTQQTLAQAIHARRSEYTQPKEIKIKVGSWNVAGYKGTEKDIGPWLVGGKGIAERLSGLDLSDSQDENGKINLEDLESVEHQERRRSKRQSTVPHNDPGLIAGDDEIGIYAVGLQEVVDITSAAEALRPYTDPSVAQRYKDALEEALPEGYVLVAEQQLIGMLLLVYAAPGLAPEISSTSTTSVGTGLMGYMGNKGATTARILLGETTRIIFVNCHLAAGADAAALERRNWDAAQILSRTRFDPVVDPTGAQQEKGEVIGDEDFAFWFGDLNYRLQGMPGDDVRRLLMLHARNEYDLSQRHNNAVEDALSSVSTETGLLDSTRSSVKDANGITKAKDKEQDEEPALTSLDPASLQATLDGLLPHDELFEQIKKRKAFQDGWREGPIRFMPTYKYDAGTVGVFDSSEKRRCPSWCDRILYRTRRDKLAYDNKIREEENVRRRDEELRNSGVDQEAQDEEVMFEYNPDNDGDDYDEFADTSEPQNVVTRDGFEDEILLETYTSHQRVLSSDHKPLVALFSLKYQAVVPELKTKVHQEVAKDLDRAENESRPTITLIIDRSVSSSDGEDTIAGSQDKLEGVDFGNARYAQSKRRSVTIANTGQVPATVGFVDRPVGAGQAEGPMPIWLSVKFDRAADKDSRSSKDNKHAQTSTETKFTLEPGDATTATLTLRVEVMELVKSLNEGTASLDDILVLHVEGGRDHFLPVRARWLQNTLGRSIDKLIRIPEGGIRRLQGQKPSGSSGHKTGLNPPSNSSGPPSPMSDVSVDKHLSATKQSGEHQQALSTKTDETDSVKWSAPRELFRLTEAVENLAQRCIADWDMRHSTPVDLTPASPQASGGAPRTPDAESPPQLPPRPDETSPTSPAKRDRSSSDELSGPKAPWEQHSGWPFWEDSWSNIDKELRLTATRNVYEALDTDKAFHELIDASVPNLPRLEAVSGALVTFLSSLTDGVITPDLWTSIEADFAVRAREKGGKTPKLDGAEDEKSHILEILSEKSSHNVSFVLITSMLHRLITEISQSDLHQSMAASTFHARERSSSSAASTATKALGLPFGRRRTLSRANEDEGEKVKKAVSQRRRLRERAYAVTFAKAMVRFPELEGLKEKERKAREDRSISVIESFLRDDR